MNVTCTGCPAKYAVPDEKVRGKKVRITCKHCGTNIVVDGTAAVDTSASASPTSTPQGTSKPFAKLPTSSSDASQALPKTSEAQPLAQARGRTIDGIVHIAPNGAIIGFFTRFHGSASP